MEEYIRICRDCGAEQRTVTKPKSEYCRSCVAKRRIKKYGNNPGFLAYCKKGACAGDKNPFYGMRHTKEARLKISKNTNKDFMKTAEYKEKVSKQCTGSGNPMYGKSVYDVWISKYGKEKADMLMEEKKKKHRISSAGARNPMYGRKAPQGSGNGWSGWYKGWYFRSLRELSYVVNTLELNGIQWKCAEDISIEYTDWEGKKRTYRPDFLVENKFIVEIKPSKLQLSPSVVSKRKSAEEFAKLKGLEYQLIDPPIMSNEQIRSLHDQKLIIFTKRYELKYRKKFS